MKKYVHFIFNHRKPLFIVFMILNIVALIGVLRVRLNTDFSLFTTNNSIYQDRLDEMDNTFGSVEQIVVLVEHDTFTTSVRDDLRSIQSSFEGIEDINMVEGVAPETILLNGVATPYDQIDPTVIQQYYSNFQEFSPLKQKDGVYYSTFTLFISPNFNRSDVKSIENILGDYTYSSYVSGDVYNQYKVVDYILSILLILPPLTILVILLVFRWQIGAFKPTILSVLPAAIGSLWTFGIIGYIGNEVSILTAVIPVFIIVIGSADGLHFMSHFQEAMHDNIPREQAMTKTLKVVGIPMIITTLTSMAGFLSLLTMNTGSIVDLSIFASVGILLAGIATWYVLPLILSGNINVSAKHPDKPKKIDFTKGLRKVWGMPSYIIVVLLVLLAVIFTSKINNEFDMLSVYKDYTIVAKNAEKLQEVNGGSIPLFIEFDADSDILSIDEMNQVDALVATLNNMDEVNHVINPYRLLQIAYATQVSGDIPNDYALKLIYNNITSSQDNVISNMFNTDQHKVRLLVFPTDMKNATLGAIEDKVNSTTPKATVTGVQYLLRDLNVSLSAMQRNSIILAIVVVFIMLAVALKDIKVASLSIIPIIVTVGAIYGVLGLSGIPLNITTVIIFSISIGVGIDYAVHFSSVYKMFLNEGHTKSDSVDLAFKNVARPIVANALGISLGLSVLMLSPLTIHLYVSTLMWVGMIVSVFVTLTFLPTIFKITKKHKLSIDK